MAYIGRGLDKISNIEVLDNITFDGSSSYSITKSSVAFTPNSAQSLLISIDGVVQATNFTVNSSTIDFGVAVPSTSTCDFFLHYGTGVAFTPSDGSVTTAKLGDGAVTSAKLDSGVALGKVLQVVSSVNTYGGQSTTSTSYVDMQTTGAVTWEVSITPSSTSNKILAIFSSQLMGTGNAQEQRNKCRLMEKIGAGAYAELTYKMQGAYNGGGAVQLQPNDNVHLMYLSSPNSTNTISYKLQILTQSSGVTLIPNHNSYSTAVLMEVSG